MAKFRYLFGGNEANWDEHLYHRSLPVVDGIVETDDELDIDALLRRGWELVVEDAKPVPAPKPVVAEENSAIEEVEAPRARRARVAPAADE
jgi:hypothetical protein